MQEFLVEPQAGWSTEDDCVVLWISETDVIEDSVEMADGIIANLDFDDSVLSLYIESDAMDDLPDVLAEIGFEPKQIEKIVFLVEDCLDEI